MRWLFATLAVCALALAGQARAQETLPPTEPLRLQLFPSLPLKPGHKAHVVAKLSRVETGRPVSINELKEMNGALMRLRVIDQSLSDYQLLAPQPTGEPGEFAFDFVPARKGAYRAWAETKLLKDNSEHTSMADLGGIARADEVIDKKPVVLTKAGNYHFALGFEKVPRAGNPATAVFIVTDAGGKPYPPLLEPRNDAFGELIAFHEDFALMVKAQPMEIARQPKEPGGPGLHFRLDPSRPGFYKFFVRVKIKGRDILVPFGISIQPNRE